MYTAREIQERLQPVFDAMPVERAVLFGSYAKGTPTTASDVDILIDSRGKIRGIDFFGVRADLMDALDLPIDLIEASQIVDGGKAQREITETGVVIYERA